jgi:hypothetical protein
VTFSCAALFSSALLTLITTLTNGFLPQLPGLALTTPHKYLLHLVPTVKGGLDQICKKLEHDCHTKCFPSSDVGNPTTCYYYTAAISPQPTGQVHWDQASRFPVVSSTGNNYLPLVYDYDSNSIQAKPMPKRTSLCILHLYRTIHTCITAASLLCKLQQLNNEASLTLKEYMTEEGIDYQLVPPGVHYRNAAECAI